MSGHSTLLPTSEHVPVIPVTLEETYVIGEVPELTVMVSTSLRDETLAGPAFVMTNVYVPLVPRTRDDGPDFVTERSTTWLPGHVRAVTFVAVLFVVTGSVMAVSDSETVAVFVTFSDAEHVPVAVSAVTVTFTMAVAFTARLGTVQ